MCSTPLRIVQKRWPSLVSGMVFVAMCCCISAFQANMHNGLYSAYGRYNCQSKLLQFHANSINTAEQPTQSYICRTTCPNLGCCGFRAKRKFTWTYFVQICANLQIVNSDDHFIAQVNKSLVQSVLLYSLTSHNITRRQGQSHPRSPARHATSHKVTWKHYQFVGLPCTVFPSSVKWYAKPVSMMTLYATIS